MYDPYLATHLSANNAYPTSYWAKHCAVSPEPVLDQTINADVAIIGAGYSGLSCALHLAKCYQAKVVLLEANQVGWGCSGRNAGFVLPGTGRLSVMQMQKKWGLACAQAIYREYKQAIELACQLIELGGDCQQTAGGYLKLAHTKKIANDFRHLSDTLNQQYAEKSRYIGANEVNHFLPAEGFWGGLYYPEYFALNPLKFSLNLANLVKQQGVELFCNSPVQDWQKQGALHRLLTPTGEVMAKQVVIASNAYTPKGFHPLVNNRYFPVMSSIVVTEPLSSELLNQYPFNPGIMAMDSRPMKYYYRLLPDKRLLFGGRGAVAGKDADQNRYCQDLLSALSHTLIPMSGLKAEYFWSGWVNVSYDDYPRMWHDQQQNTAYLGGYCGSGVSFSLQAGKRLAQLITGDQKLPDLPFWQTPMPSYPAPFMRRLALRMMYQWLALKHRVSSG